MDLHWGTSEHADEDGVKNEAEIQLHHFDLSYGSYEEAQKFPGAIVSLAIRLKVNLLYGF